MLVEENKAPYMSSSNRSVMLITKMYSFSLFSHIIFFIFFPLKRGNIHAILTHLRCYLQYLDEPWCTVTNKGHLIRIEITVVMTNQTSSLTITSHWGTQIIIINLTLVLLQSDMYEAHSDDRTHYSVVTANQTSSFTIASHWGTQMIIINLSLVFLQGYMY